MLRITTILSSRLQDEKAIRRVWWYRRHLHARADLDLRPRLRTALRNATCSSPARGKNLFATLGPNWEHDSRPISRSALINRRQVVNTGARILVKFDGAVCVRSQTGPLNTHVDESLVISPHNWCCFVQTQFDIAFVIDAAHCKFPVTKPVTSSVSYELLTLLYQNSESDRVCQCSRLPTLVVAIHILINTSRVPRTQPELAVVCRYAWSGDVFAGR